MDHACFARVTVLIDSRSFAVFAFGAALLCHLHELDGRAVRIAHIDDVFPGVRSHFESLWFARGFPTGCCDFF